MDKVSDFIDLIDENGGDENIVGVQMDNAIFLPFNEDIKFDRTKHLKKIGDVDYIVYPSLMYSKPNGLQDIEMVSYHPIDLIQTVVFIKDASKRPYIDNWRFVNQNFT